MKRNKESGLPRGEAGQASRLLLILAAVVLVAGVIVYLVIRMATPAPKPKVEIKTTPTPNAATTTLAAAYEKQLNNIKFIFQSAINRGIVLNAVDVINNPNSSQVESINATPGGKFIQVTVGARNEGKQNIAQGSWDLGNIVDDQGREFIPMEPDTVSPWIFNSDSCGSLLMPAFDPTPCTKIYQVSDASTGLKITVEDKEKGSSGSVSLPGKTTGTTFLLDLIIK